MSPNGLISSNLPLLSPTTFLPPLTIWHTQYIFSSASLLSPTSSPYQKLSAGPVLLLLCFSSPGMKSG
jgi:hypothetical protein